MFRNAFPDLYMFIQDIIAEEDVVAIRFMLAGTHEGIFMDIAPTGRTVEVGGCSIFHFGDGQIIERWQEFDMLGLYAQLGHGWLMTCHSSGTAMPISSLAHCMHSLRRAS